MEMYWLTSTGFVDSHCYYVLCFYLSLSFCLSSSLRIRLHSLNRLKHGLTCFLLSWNLSSLNLSWKIPAEEPTVHPLNQLLWLKLPLLGQVPAPVAHITETNKQNRNRHGQGGSCGERASHPNLHVLH